MNDYKYVVINAKASSVIATSAALCLCFLLTFYLAFSDRTVTSTVSSDGVQIIIDAGHGGIDGGTQAADGTLEKNLNLDIALKIESLLNEQGIRTVMTRNSDDIDYSTASTTAEKKKHDIYSRMNIIKKYPNALFISVHQNFYSDSSCHGAQVFYSPNNKNSRHLAECIQNSIVSIIQPDNSRQVKESGSEIYLLKNAVSPAVMVECGFLSNTADAECLSDEVYRLRMAEAICSGIMKYNNTSE